MMKERNAENRTDPEKVIAAGLVYSSKFFHELSKLKKELLSEVLSTKTAKTLSRWCFEYHEKYSVPPKESIIDVRDLRLKATDDDDEKDDIELVSKLIDAVLNSFDEDENWDHRIDQAFEYIRKRKFESLNSKLELLIDAGDIKGAEEVVTGFSSVKKESAAGISLIGNRKDVIRILNEDEGESVIQIPGAIGDLLGPMQRGDLVGIVSPAKRGKSWWLQEFGIRAMLNRKTAVYYSLEMSEHQMFNRICQRLTVGLKRGAGQRDINIPCFDEDGSIEMNVEKVSEYSSNKVSKKLRQIQMISGSGDLHVACFPAYSADVKQIKLHLIQLEKEKGIVPDVIIVDYADILAPGIKQEYRHQIDHTWKMLRSLAQDRNALVITASHSNKSTFTKDMTQEDLSEDIRKMNHVSSMIGLNQKNTDKKIGVIRAVSLAQRHDSFNPDDEVVVLYDYNTGRPIIDSRWKKDTNYMSLAKHKDDDEE